VTQVDTFIATEDSQYIAPARPRRAARRLSLRHLWSVRASGEQHQHHQQQQQQPYWTISWRRQRSKSHGGGRGV